MKSSEAMIRLAIAKIAFITARIIASLDFISAVQYMISFISFRTLKFTLVSAYSFCEEPQTSEPKNEIYTLQFLLHKDFKDVRAEIF